MHRLAWLWRALGFAAFSLLFVSVPVGCRPEMARAYMTDAHNLPCLAEDRTEPLDYDSPSPLGFAPREVEAAFGTGFAPEGLRRRPPHEPSYESFDPDVGFLPTARLVDIALDERSWELVERPEHQGPNGTRGWRARRHAPNGGPRPDFSCMTGQIVRGWGTATAVFDHEVYGELTWDIEGWVEAQSTDPDEMVFLFADWRKRSWRIPRRWRTALREEVTTGNWCPVQAQAVVEGQRGWGGWFTIHVVREICPMGERVTASPLVDFRWINISYEPGG